MKSCFGTIYPDLDQLEFGRPVAGKVFQIRIDSQGAGHRDRRLEIDQDAWQECQQCSDFQNCRDFSSAKLEMQRTIREL